MEMLGRDVQDRGGEGALLFDVASYFIVYSILQRSMDDRADVDIVY